MDTLTNIGLCHRKLLFFSDSYIYECELGRSYPYPNPMVIIVAMMSPYFKEVITLTHTTCSFNLNKVVI